MSLINCPECGKEISDNSEKCIHCGFPLKKSNKTTKRKTGIFVLIIVLAIVFIAGGVGAYFFFFKGSSKKTVCSVEGCENPVYIDNLCMEHYRSADSTEKTVASDEVDNSNKGEGFEEDKPIVKSFNRNSKVSADSCDFTLTGYSIDSKIVPTDPQGYTYTYYEATSGNTFVDVKFSIKNTSSSEIRQADVLDSVKVIYDGTYEYSCFYVTVDNEGDFESYTTLYGINPLTTMEYHMIAEVPSEVKSSGKSLMCRIEDNGKIYECTLR